MRGSTVTVVVLLLSIAACGGQIADDLHAPPASDGGSIAEVDATSPVDASVAPPSRPDAAGAPLPDAAMPVGIDSGPPLHYATIYGETLAAGGGSVASAQFSTVAGTPAVCTLSTPANRCAVATCGLAANDPSANAGALIVSDGVTSATLDFSAGPPGTYGTLQVPGAGWAAPSTLTFSGGGGPALPAGIMKSVPFPPGTMLTTPNLATTAAIATNAPLDLAWSPTVATEVVIVIESSPGNTESTYAFLACIFDGASGVAQIPQADLTAVKMMAVGSPQMFAGFFTLARTLDVEQGWSIDVAALGPGGGAAEVTLE